LIGDFGTIKRMSIFVTGATGFLGSYIVANLLTQHEDRLSLLIRSRSIEEAEQRLWQSLQLHFDFKTFFEYRRSRIDFFLGDVTHPDLGLDADRHDRLIRTTDSIIHCAAALNRRSSEACMNVNLRGTLETIKLAQAAHDHHGLRRFSNISSVAVSGQRRNEVVTEDKAIQWTTPDLDPYGRTKKFAEYMVHRLLADVPVVIFRPSAIIGDTRFPQTTQFDMVRAFTLFLKSPVIPFHPDWRLDIVPADYVSHAIVAVHQKEKPTYTIYHVSSGTDSLTYRQIMQSLLGDQENLRKIFVPRFLKIFSRICDRLAETPPKLGLARPATLIQVFLPHLESNTVFDNTRIKQELGEAPKPFGDYARSLLRFAQENNFRYPYRPWTFEEIKREVA